MLNQGGRKKRIGYRGDGRVPYARQGWEDARLGRPFDYALLDRATDRAFAAAYETMRLRVLALRDAGLTVPQWKSSKSVPPVIHGALTRTAEMNKAGREDAGRSYWPVGRAGWLPAAA
jgi:hypothetical protein